jgi:hypothetical protein
MADDKTEHFGNGSSFEDRIMARFDAVERRFDGVVERLSALEAKVDDRLRETRQIWEKALAEIMAVGENVKEMKAQLSVLGEDVLSVRAKQREADLRLKELESFLHRG